MEFSQAAYQIRCEWGLRGLQELAPSTEVAIVVDVLSFCTALDIAVARGATVFPYPLKGDAAAAYAAAVNARLASARRGEGFSLSPSSLLNVESETRLVLPSPNGAGLAHSARHPVVIGACLRNAAAVARFAASQGSSFAVIPAGETWDNGSLRPCLADWIGAGAIIAALPGSRSPEARSAAAAFAAVRGVLAATLRDCGSGLELIERGFAQDVELAAELDVSRTVPLRQSDGGFTPALPIE